MRNPRPRFLYKGGSSSGGGKHDPMNVPYDEWGEEIQSHEVDSGEDFATWEEDILRYTSEEDLTDATKRDVIDAILSYRDDDGLWTDDDMTGYIVYDTGKLIDVKDLKGKSFPRKGIIGAYFQDAHQAAAWGNEWVRGSSGRMEQVPMTVTTSDERELSNTYVGYTITGWYRERVRTTYKTGQKYPQRRTIRKSAVKPTGNTVHRK